MMKLFIIGIGGFFGAMARYGVSIWIGQNWGRSFPLGTLVVNVTGCFLIGFFMPLLTVKFMASPNLRLFLTIGFLGAYTTFSTFEYETGALITDGEWLFAALNVFLSVLAGFVALKMGETLAHSL
ncbi:MAG: camphor resistance protein CrcB [Nitrospirae bacterium GWC1_57_7]|jgi:fluoride exporter|nr:MAG: camphor resistance protein CrcB [Nitrospirae bacterium GWC1_57_7]OGW44784.1 MAG: camphor resistance protein CrcB [Nitrospirae bacterium GWD2_57_8]HAR46257.1 fluoride efflux transporter CrcB [Nitrospiraceae bacterium]